jgi:hypoxanthine phosphoribosyltransferase
MSADYAGKSLLVLGVLHGAFVFMADLIRRLTIPVRCGFVMVSSYGDRTSTSGRVRLKLDATLPVEGNHVLLVDDIVDTGISTAWLLDHLTRKKPASLRLCALLDKPARRRTPVNIDYVGFEVPDRFVVGYGIDCAGRHRELPYVGYVPSDEQS